MKPLEHRSVQCIYCDDIRDEVDGKTTIVGWYGSEFVQMPPEGALVLPTLGVIALVVMPPEPRFESFRLELLQGETLLQGIDLPPEAVANLQAENEDAENKSMGRQVRIAIRLQNLLVAEPGVIALRVILDKEVLHANRLRFKR
ncbi:DUF6941 family protein [Rhodoferax antarcticus]|uniref:DUF6941 family protein n=1 Tax=Rhodoferax antarcticus TaxID=81479 RepID=UPI0009581181|nr:hypothetical protein [Rhodoferax antarcticus]APW48669.1 hypothetical protein RA876_19635 [Rhodoferax antarcticus]